MQFIGDLCEALMYLLRQLIFTHVCKSIFDSYVKCLDVKKKNQKKKNGNVELNTEE